MTKRRCPFTLHGVAKAAIDEAGGNEAVMVLLPHRKTGWLFAATNPDLEERHAVEFKHSEIRTLTAAGITAFAQDLAQLLGMTLVPLEARTATTGEIMARGASVMKAAAETAGVIATACADGQVDAGEKQLIGEQLLDVKRAAHEALLALGNGT